MDNLYRRATAGKTALDALAGVFLLCSLAFWGVLHWQVLVTPGGGVPQVIVAVVMTAIYSLALPVLLSALVPSTPAAQLLQRTKWATIGFWVIIPSVAFLFWHAYNLMLSWFASQPTIADAGLERPYTVSALIAFVVIVALAWTQASPDRWLREVQQAHEVRKLELMQRGELAIVKARLLWAEQRAAVSYAKLLPAEQQEVQATLRGLLMGIADTQRSIARTMGLQGEIERNIMGDEEISEALSYVARQLEKPAQSMDKAITHFNDGERENPDPDQDLSRAAPVNQASQSLEPRRERAAPRSAPQRYAAEYATANQRLGPLFTVRQVAAELGDMPERTARDMVDAWHAQGWVEPGNIRGQWRFLTE